ncbi:unnamed protein product [Cuscuta epithymum]|uniref:Uncharacterized protein n=1 Tax=Cuscuta epithymum TaxID=186058 RepID=A0AAV0GLT0_9ASTE|nr:unnamed protein product [Cuscuta epithymum]
MGGVSKPMLGLLILVFLLSSAVPPTDAFRPAPLSRLGGAADHKIPPGSSFRHPTSGGGASAHVETFQPTTPGHSPGIGHSRVLPTKSNNDNIKAVGLPKP